MNAERPIIELSRAMLSPASHQGSPKEPPLSLTPSNLSEKGEPWCSHISPEG